MDVIHVPGQVIIRCDRMLPKSPLPNPRLTPLLPGFAPFPFLAACRQIPHRKLPFDLLPPDRIIVIPFRQRPDRVKVFRQQADRHGCERVTILNNPPHLVQDGSGVFAGEDGVSVTGHHGEIIGVCSIDSAIIGHMEIIE